jgi:hypothetical protein
VYASHANGKDIVSAILHLVETFCPIRLYFLFVGEVIEIAESVCVPFPYVIPEKRLAM